MATPLNKLVPDSVLPHFGSCFRLLFSGCSALSVRLSLSLLVRVPSSSVPQSFLTVYISSSRIVLSCPFSFRSLLSPSGCPVSSSICLRVLVWNRKMLHFATMPKLLWWIVNVFYFRPVSVSQQLFLRLSSLVLTFRLWLLSLSFTFISSVQDKEKKKYWKLPIVAQ